MFKIVIKDLNLFGYHGVKDSEKKNGQNFCFNMEIFLGKNNFLGSDNLENTLNYSSVIKILKDINNNQRFNLLETLCQAIANKIIGMSDLVERVYVRVEKTSPPIKENIESVGVEYTLNREDLESMGESSLETAENNKIHVYMSLGSNIGDRENNLRKAVDLIDSLPHINVLEVSSIYETEPMYFKNQNYFYNIVLKAEVDREVNPFEMLGYLKGIEYSFGSKKDIRYGPRIIDIDLLYYGDMTIKTDFLNIPHPGIEERNFVLVPLSEISPDFVIKGNNIKKFIEEAGFTESANIVKGW
jgi:dihydroneopterin aldolase / 2-amino-4-hydroxy-6-hydroxymethyldihydropteridine diphosphokinase